MDLSSSEITFDENGVCNFCHQAQKVLKEMEIEKPNLAKRIEQIKKDGEGGNYSCLIGLSGGVDSSTTLHNAVKLGLRPLCFSLDNGWNDPIADENVKRLVEKLKVPFIKYEIDLIKFRDLQGAFMRAGLIGIEIPTDHCLFAVIYELANKYGIKWILSGGNTATESIMPKSWGYNPWDLKHIKDVYKKMTGKKLTGLPVLSLARWNWLKWVRGIRIFNLLDYLDYNRKKSEQMLVELYDFSSTNEKHEENIFTKWYQNFYLYKKFGIDKRKAHYASLINSGQLDKKTAMEMLSQSPIYPQLGLEQKVMKYPKQRHENFKNNEQLFNLISKIIKWIKLIGK